MPLILAGIVQDQKYFEREVEPFLGPDARYVGPVGPKARDDLLGGALGLLHLIHFEEPFGLSVVEAMACGTPVIAYRRGSMAEILQDGVGGFLVENEDQAVRALSRLSSLKRSSVRATVERFSIERMVNGYLDVYRVAASIEDADG